MPKRIKQQAKGDCAVCALAMFLGKEHSEILECFPFLLYKMGEDENGDFVERGGLTKTEMLFIIQSATGSSPMLLQNIWDIDDGRIEELFDIIKGRKAILSARSLNYPGVAHAVYWDGSKVIDPSNKKRYTKKTIKPFEVIL